MLKTRCIHLVLFSVNIQQKADLIKHSCKNTASVRLRSLPIVDEHKRISLNANNLVNVVTLLTSPTYVHMSQKSFLRLLLTRFCYHQHSHVTDHRLKNVWKKLEISEQAKFQLEIICICIDFSMKLKL